MLPPAQAIEAQSDSLIAILADQCGDLETLLALARSETRAVEARDFGEVMRVVSERAALGERLESYHRQLAELRQRLGESCEPGLRSAAAARSVALVVEIQAQDARTRPLLLAAQCELLDESLKLDQARRGVGAYLRDARHTASTACDCVA